MVIYCFQFWKNRKARTLHAILVFDHSVGKLELLEDDIVLNYEVGIEF